MTFTKANDIKQVPKIWGSEIWVVNKDYCGKKLVLNKGFRCSLHYHKKKDEVFYCIKGKIRLENKGEVYIMVPGDSYHVKQGDKHRFTGLEDSEIIEFSSHHEDDDSYRDIESGKVPDDEWEQIKNE